MVRLGDVCEFRRGLTYAKADEVEHSSKIVLRSNNIDLETGLLDFSELKYLREDFQIPDDKRIVPHSLLMCMANGSKPHLGKVALIEDDLNYAFGGFMGLILPNGIVPKYLFFALASPSFKQCINQLQSGANINNLKFSDIEDYSIPLPPLAVQREIVERLERELADADSLAANFKRIAELADAEFKAELDETFMQLGGKPVRLEDKCKISYGYTGEAVSGPQEDLPKYLRITDIQNNTVEWERVPACKCPNYEKFRLLQGDIVFARTGATTGKSYLLQGDFPRAVYASYLIRLRIQDTSIDPYFLKYYFGTSKYWEAIESGMAGAAQGGFNSTKLGALTVAIPSRDEQRKTVAQLNAASEQCEKLKTAAMHGATRAETLRAAILSEAFSP